MARNMRYIPGMAALSLLAFKIIKEQSRKIGSSNIVASGNVSRVRKSGDRYVIEILEGGKWIVATTESGESISYTNIDTAIRVQRVIETLSEG